MKKIYMLSIDKLSADNTLTKKFLGVFDTHREAYEKGRDYILKMSERQMIDVDINHYEEGLLLKVGAVFQYSKGEYCYTSAEFLWVSSHQIDESDLDNIRAAVSLAADETLHAQHPEKWKSAVELLERL